MSKTHVRSLIGGAAALLVLSLPSTAAAHCDTLDGPVVKAAREALARKDVTPVLRWVRPEAEPEIRQAFERTLKVRQAGGESQALADQFFFETLVRVHRLGEGATYTGLQPAGSVEHAIALADQALESKSDEALVAALSKVVANGLRTRYAEAAAAARHADSNVEAGRAFVAAYVEFIHYAERVHQAATISAAHQHGAETHK